MSDPGSAPRFSANTGFLYPGLDFLARIRAAARDGFDALEFHDEGQRVERARLREVLDECGLPVLGLNVAMGPSAGCAAIPGREARARADIDAAIELAEDIDAGAIHVLAGRTEAPEARETFLGALEHALAATSRTILIEPLCTAKMPDYWLRSLDEAAAIVAELDRPNLRILFDCFHVETEHGDTLARLREHVAAVGHVQIASVPERAEPRVGARGTGSLDYAELLPAFRAAGYAGAFGCEYTPTLDGGASLAWREAFAAPPSRGGGGGAQRGAMKLP